MLFILVIAFLTNCCLVGGKQILKNDVSPGTAVNIPKDNSGVINKYDSTNTILANDPSINVNKNNSTDSVVASLKEINITPVTDSSECKYDKDIQTKSQSTLPRGKQIVEGFDVNPNIASAYLPKLPTLDNMPSRSIRGANIGGHDVLNSNIGSKYVIEWGNTMQTGYIWLGNNLVGLLQNPEESSRMITSINPKQSIGFNPFTSQSQNIGGIYCTKGIFDISLQNSNISNGYSLVNSVNRQLQNIRDLCRMNANAQQQNTAAGYKDMNVIPQLQNVGSSYMTINGYQQPNVDINYIIASNNEPCDLLGVSSLNQNLDGEFIIVPKQNTCINSNFGTYEAPIQNQNAVYQLTTTGIGITPQMNVFNDKYYTGIRLNQQNVGIKNNALRLKANTGIRKNYYAQLNSITNPYLFSFENTGLQKNEAIGNPYWINTSYRAKISPLLFNRVNTLSSNILPQFRYSNPLFSSSKTR